jgi:hypothetical protein
MCICMTQTYKQIHLFAAVQAMDYLVVFLDARIMHFVQHCLVNLGSFTHSSVQLIH